MYDIDKFYGYWKGGIFRKYGLIGYDLLELINF